MLSAHKQEKFSCPLTTYVNKLGAFFKLSGWLADMLAWWSAGRQTNGLTQMLSSQLAWRLNPLLEMRGSNYDQHSSVFRIQQPCERYVSSTFIHHNGGKTQKKNLRGLTLSCCPWFSYHIATAPCCRRRLSSAVREYLPLVLPPSPAVPASILSDTGRKAAETTCSWVRQCSKLCCLSSVSLTWIAVQHYGAYFPQQTPLQEVLSKIWWRQRVRWAPWCRCSCLRASFLLLKMSNKHVA